MSRQGPFDRLPPLHQKVVFVGGFVLTGLSWWMYSGPYRWISELQLWLFGRYATKISLLIALFLILIALTALALLVSSETTEGQARPESRALDEFVYSGFGKCILAALFCLVMGSYHGARAFESPRQIAVALEEVEQSPSAERGSRWWEVSGTLLLDEQQVWNDAPKYHYVPLVSSAWSEGSPIRLVVLAKGTAYPKLAASGGRVSGIIDKSGMPGDVAAYWGSSAAPVDGDTVLLHFDETPDTNRTFAAALLGIGVLFLGGAFLLRRRTNAFSAA